MTSVEVSVDFSELFPHAFFSVGEDADEPTVPVPAEVWTAYQVAGQRFAEAEQQLLRCMIDAGFDPGSVHPDVRDYFEGLT